MSVTFSGAFTFTGGGFTASLAPPPSDPTAGWFAGGTDSTLGNHVSTVQRITYATDTATASIRGPLYDAKSAASGVGTATDGWFAGGQDSSSTITSTVQRITYATDTATASNRGILAYYSRAQGSTSDNTTYGWFGGGYVSGVGTSCIVQRMTYATDTATASIRGPLSAVSRYLAAVGITTSGWFGGGINSGGFQSNVDRITYATDTATASVRGPLSSARYALAATGDNTTYGWFGCGVTVPGGPSGVLSLVDRITYANDTVTASVRGPLSLARRWLNASTDNTTYGWFGAGYLPGGGLSTVDRITYATDTATAGVRGPLAAPLYKPAATSGVQ